MTRATIHAVLELAAFVVAAWLYSRIRKAQSDPLPGSRRSLIIIAAAAGALIGSRLLGGLEHPSRFAGLSATQWIAQAYQCKSVVGGLLGALIGVEGVKAFVGERRRSGDLFTYPIIAALIVGRVGCFIGGVEDGTAGIVSAVPWALDQGDGLPRHPTSLYEIVFLCGVAAALHRLGAHRVLEEGRLFALFLTSYLAWRLAIDFLKPAEVTALSLSPIQWACVAGLLHYACYFRNAASHQRSIHST